MNGRRESEVLSGVISYLHSRRDVWFWRNNSGAASFSPGSFTRFGIPGAADIIGVQAPYGRMFAVECKRELGGTVSKAQEAWGSNLERCGGLYIVARGFDAVARALGPVKSS